MVYTKLTKKIIHMPLYKIRRHTEEQYGPIDFYGCSIILYYNLGKDVYIHNKDVLHFSTMIINILVIGHQFFLEY